MASSDWNCSNDFPSGGSTITLGPVGIVAHPVSARNAAARNILFPYLNIASLSFILRDRRRYNPQPAFRTLFDIGIVALGLRAVIPVTLFLLLRCRLYIYLWLLLGDDRRPRIVWIWIIRIGIVRITPPWVQPTRANPYTSTIRVSRSVIVSWSAIVSRIPIMSRPARAT
jgi:hypothetical protein